MILKCHAKVILFSFADDTTLCLSNADVPTLYLNANAEINQLHHWFYANKSMLNATKTKYFIIKPKTKKMQCGKYVFRDWWNTINENTK